VGNSAGVHIALKKTILASVPGAADFYRKMPRGFQMTLVAVLALSLLASPSEAANANVHQRLLKQSCGWTLAFAPQLRHLAGAQPWGHATAAPLSGHPTRVGHATCARTSLLREAITSSPLLAGRPLVNIGLRATASAADTVRGEEQERVFRPVGDGGGEGEAVKIVSYNVLGPKQALTDKHGYVFSLVGKGPTHTRTQTQTHTHKLTCVRAHTHKHTLTQDLIGSVVGGYVNGSSF